MTADWLTLSAAPDVLYILVPPTKDGIDLKQILLFAILALSTEVLAKTEISVLPFAVKSEESRCAGTSAKARANLDRELQEKLISGLLELKRFQVQQREVRQLKPKHSLVGTVRTFEVCAGQGRGQSARIAIDVQLRDAKTGLTHVFTSSAKTASATADRAPELAIHVAINEIIKLVDDAVPRREPPLRLRAARSTANSMMVKLIPRKRVR